MSLNAYLFNAISYLNNIQKWILGEILGQFLKNIKKNKKIFKKCLHFKKLYYIIGVESVTEW